jgi:DNA-binding beta-propeller fold protein YncE
VADTGNNVIRKIEQGTVSTFAGTIVGYKDGPANQARFAAPTSVAVDSTGDKVYVVDFLSSCIRLIENDEVSSFAGQCQAAGFADGPLLTAKFSLPAGIGLDASGNRILVADTANHRIRLIENNQVSTIAGTGIPGHVDGPAASAQLHTPVEVTIGPDGKIYVSEHGQSHRIRVIDPTSGEGSTLAGSGNKGFADGPAAVASFSKPSGLAVLPNGVIYIADTDNHRIRVYFENKVGTLAGVGTPGHKDGPGNVAFFNKPNGLVVDLTTGIGYLTDTDNHRIRLVTP